jgi:hypothetical protein
LDEHDLLYYFLQLWSKRYSQIPKKDKKSFHRLKRHLTQTILLFYPFLHIVKPNYIPGHLDSLIKRTELLQQLLDSGPSEFYAKQTTCKAFEVEELDFFYVKRIAAIAPLRTPIGVP